MSDKIAPISSTTDAQPIAVTTPAMTPAVVDYVVAFRDVENPLQLQALMHQKMMLVYKVLTIDGEVVQVLSLESCSIIDERYLIN
ncbi:MAG: hypothetical protein JSS86_19870 [Cyanobacteria bacterium SZAS LIN-2]|nr:hypothetical protein [Cyanobacteria bacterium SZAS LIN-3]MBS1998597.1 hypothetical protein [Cyanobacteria bacterium SZAS LIN-2]MBS2011217.1 hypothetical protein [Cyanobacteria bacterium SZAS TMP-1]